jgi:hypothetical protein
MILSIVKIIDAVILDPEDATHLIEKLKVPALAIMGEEDYVRKPPRLETLTVPGGHISPHELAKEIKEAIKAVLSPGKK